MNQKRVVWLLFYLILCIIISACSGGGSDSTPAPAPLSSSKAITVFNIVSPAATGVITESTHSIAITVPNGTIVTALIPTITQTGASISPASGVAQNFTNPVIYTVTAADASTQDYTVTVTVAASLYNFVTTWGSYGTGTGQFEDPVGVAVDTSKNVDVADNGNARIQAFSSSGTFITTWGSYGTVV